MLHFKHFNNWFLYISLMNFKRIFLFLWLIHWKRKHCPYIPNVRLFLAVYLVILWFKIYWTDKLNVQTNVKCTQLFCTLIPGSLATLTLLCTLIRKKDTTYLQMLVLRMEYGWKSTDTVDGKVIVNMSQICIFQFHIIKYYFQWLLTVTFPSKIFNYISFLDFLP